MVGDPSWLHVLGHRRVHQPRSVHVHPQPVAVSEPADLGEAGEELGWQGPLGQPVPT